MKKININEAQSKELSRELARLVFEFKKDSSVECIYFTPYVDSTYGNIVDIRIVGDYSSLKDIEKELKEYNLIHQSQEFIDKYAVKINLGVDTAWRYTTVALNPSEIRREKNLYNSEILYDATGKYTKIKKQATEFSSNVDSYIHKYNDLAEFVPPIDNELTKALDFERIESDTKAVKEFTKTKLFEQIKNM